VSGTVNIARSIFDHELFADQPLTEREAWIWLIMEASWKPRKKRVGDYIVDLARGQLAASVRFMAAAWRWTPAKVQRFVKRLQSLDMIAVKTDTGVSVVTICNYDEYQAPNKTADTGPIQVRYRSDTNEKKDEIREEEDSTLLRSKPKPERFDEFWEAYPHRGGARRGKKPAQARYARIVAGGVLEQTIIDGAARSAKDRQVIDGYARDPTTWLNQEGWTDEVLPAQSQDPERAARLARIAKLSGGQ
jgi:hypothetical protein